MENLIAGHPVVGLLKHPLGFHNIDINQVFCIHCKLRPLREAFKKRLILFGHCPNRPNPPSIQATWGTFTILQFLETKTREYGPKHPFLQF